MSFRISAICTHLRVLQSLSEYLLPKLQIVVLMELLAVRVDNLKKINVNKLLSSSGMDLGQAAEYPSAQTTIIR